MATVFCIPTKRELKYLRKLFADGYTQTTILRDAIDTELSRETWHAVNKANESKLLDISEELRSLIADCIADPDGKRLHKRARKAGLAGW